MFTSARIAPFAVATLALFGASPALAGPVQDATLIEAAATIKPGGYLWHEDVAAGLVAILISIADQKAYVYRGGAVIAVSAVSTGKEGNETPVGLFTILQKKAMHHSNLYDDAPMPYMQRLTWDGIAIHAGRNPGFPASHGCIRVPTAFAKKLFAATEMGATVEVVDYPVDGATPAPQSDAEMTERANRAADFQIASVGPMR